MRPGNDLNPARFHQLVNNCLTVRGVSHGTTHVGREKHHPRSPAAWRARRDRRERVHLERGLFITHTIYLPTCRLVTMRGSRPGC